MDALNRIKFLEDRLHRLSEIGMALSTEKDTDRLFEMILEEAKNITRADGRTLYSMNENGDLVTSEGFPVEPGITIPQDTIDITINQSGEVLVKIEGQVDLTNLGQITTAIFPNEAGLEAIGDNFYLETTASGAPIEGNPNEDGYGAIQQGALENSNVDVVEEITNMITAQRAYEMNSKVIRTSDEMLSTVAQLR